MAKHFLGAFLDAIRALQTICLLLWGCAVRHNLDVNKDLHHYSTYHTVPPHAVFALVSLAVGYSSWFHCVKYVNRKQNLSPSSALARKCFDRASDRARCHEMPRDATTCRDQLRSSVRRNRFSTTSCCSPLGSACTWAFLHYEQKSKKTNTKGTE